MKAFNRRQAELQRETISAAYDQQSKSLDSLLNFETVKYFGTESYEVERYKEAVFKCEDWRFSLTDSIEYSVKDLPIEFGTLALSLLCLYKVVHKEGVTIGDYVLFGTYVHQLYQPFYYFGWIIR